MGRATKEIRKRIEKKEERLGRELTIQEKRKIEKSVIRRVRRENAIRATIAVVGLGIGGLLGFEGQKLLTDYNNTKIEEEKENQARKQFLEGVAISEDMLTQGNEQGEKIDERAAIQQEVDNLESQEDILDYIKSIYVKEYNEKYGENITIEQLSLYKSRFDYNLNYSQAKNGDSIIRYSTNTNKSGLDTSKGVICSAIQYEDSIKREKVFNSNGYKTIYSEEEEVGAYNNNFLTQIAGIVDKGIDWYGSIPEENTSAKLKEEYKRQFIDAIYEYNKEKTNEKEDTERD